MKALVDPECVTNQWVFAGAPPLTGKASIAYKVSKVRYNKQQPQKTGLVRVVEVQPQAIVVDDSETNHGFDTQICSIPWLERTSFCDSADTYFT